MEDAVDTDRSIHSTREDLKHESMSETVEMSDMSCRHFIFYPLMYGGYFFSYFVPQRRCRIEPIEAELSVISSSLSNISHALRLSQGRRQLVHIAAFFLGSFTKQAYKEIPGGF